MARRVFDPKLAIGFHEVVDAGSITAAAVRLGVTQPWMSEQLRKLEGQIGDQLLLRTSRRLALTRAGEEFLPFARALAEANAAAQQSAAALRDRHNARLEIGACEYAIGLRERLRLVEQLVQREPGVTVHVRHASMAALISGLLDGSYDLIIVHRNGIRDNPDIDTVLLADRQATLMMRDDDPLAVHAELTPAHLRGRRLYVSPGSDDPLSMTRSLKPLVDAGMEIRPCPDNERRLIELMAFQNRELCLKWSPDSSSMQPTTDMISRPFTGPAVTSPIALARRAGEAPGRPVRVAWQIAAGIGAEG